MNELSDIIADLEALSDAIADYTEDWVPRDLNLNIERLRKLARGEVSS